MFDLIISSKRAVTPQGVQAVDIGIRDGRIAVVAEYQGLADADAARRIDASEQIVVPGSIDPHVHCAWPIPSTDGSPPLQTAPPADVSRAALYGGTTTMIDFAVWNPGETLDETIARRDLDWEGKCACDYAYHIMLQGRVPPEVLEQLGRKIGEGYPSVVKILTDG